MDFELLDEHRMIKETITRFVNEQLLPLEAAILQREAQGEGGHLSADE